jgi:hypothetical protein
MSRLPLRTDELFGVVKSNSEVRFYGAWLAEWILDYSSYDPSISTEGEEPLRNGLLVVRPDQGADFCKVMRPNEIDAGEVKEYLKKRFIPIDFYIDFDRALFINGFHEIAIEDYVPAGWTSEENDPLQFVPDDLRALWNNGRRGFI